MKTPYQENFDNDPKADTGQSEAAEAGARYVPPPPSSSSPSPATDVSVRNFPSGDPRANGYRSGVEDGQNSGI